MTNKTINAKLFKEMIEHGSSLLTLNADYVDSLNVFPVPDGDTGCNMSLSMQAGVKEIANETVPTNLGNLATKLSKGLLMGARGNSGVILSQLFRGFAKQIANCYEINTEQFAKALITGVNMAYSSVMRPVEGTILTVAKDAANHALKIAKIETDFVNFMESVVKEASLSLQKTPKLLSKLAEAGVVDSGGQGLLYIYEGFLATLKGEKFSTLATKPRVPARDLSDDIIHLELMVDPNEIVYGYCTEFTIKADKNKPIDEMTLRKELSSYGDSLVVVLVDNIIKVHIHSEAPGICLTYGQRYGSLLSVKIENMREQAIAAQAVRNAKLEREIAVIAICVGEGIVDLFTELGAETIIEGGQTFNPSTEEILNAIESVFAKEIYILPNNKNVILAAKQAASLTEKSVTVLETKTIPEGISALFVLDKDQSSLQNFATVKETISKVKTGEITTAVRDAKIDGKDICAGDVLGLIDGQLNAIETSVLSAANTLIEKLIDQTDVEILTIIYGANIDDDEALKFQAECIEKYPDIEFPLVSGEQPLYDYIFGAEKVI